MSLQSTEYDRSCSFTLQTGRANETTFSCTREPFACYLGRISQRVLLAGRQQILVTPQRAGKNTEKERLEHERASEK